MRTLQAISAAALVLALAGGALAQEEEVSVSTEDGIGGAPGKFAVGAWVGLGMAHAAGDGYARLQGFDDDDMKPKFTAGGGFYFDLYLMPNQPGTE